MQKENCWLPLFPDTRQEAKSSLFEYIEIFYNRKRRHSYLGLVSPNVNYVGFMAHFKIFVQFLI